jgi:uncharacterized protein (TIGR00251 family)
MSDKSLLEQTPAPWRRTAKEGAVLRVHAQPGAKKTECVGEFNGALKIRLNAPPVDGKANETLCRFIAATLGLPKNRVSLLRGDTAREKEVLIRDA